MKNKTRVKNVRHLGHHAHGFGGHDWQSPHSSDMLRTSAGMTPMGLFRNETSLAAASNFHAAGDELDPIGVEIGAVPIGEGTRVAIDERYHRAFFRVA